MSHRLMTEVPSFDNTDRTFGGATGLLVSWCPWPGLGIPWKRTGEHARDWAAWQTTIFVYLSDKVGDNLHEICLSPSQYPAAQKHFESEDVKKTKQKSISFQMQHGSVLILRGKESHSCWDMTHSPSISLDAPAGRDNDDEMVDLAYRGDFFLEFESIHPLRFLNEKRLRPPVRIADAVKSEKRLTPLFFHVSDQKPPAVLDLNEQPPPPPKANETPAPASPIKKKKRAPAKKRARPAPKKKADQEEEEEDEK